MMRVKSDGTNVTMATLLNIIDSVYRKNTGKMTTEASSAQKQNRGKHRLSSILPVSRIF